MQPAAWARRALAVPFVLITFMPVLGVGVIVAFIVFYWLPISGELGSGTAKSAVR
jgi:hypothetical protein